MRSDIRSPVQRLFFNSTSSTTRHNVNNIDRKIGVEGGAVYAPQNTLGENARGAFSGPGGSSVQGQGNTVTITQSDQGAFDFAASALNAGLSAQSAFGTAALSQIGSLAEPRVTDGQSVTQKTVLYLALGLGALWLISKLIGK